MISGEERPHDREGQFLVTVPPRRVQVRTDESPQNLVSACIRAYSNFTSSCLARLVPEDLGNDVTTAMAMRYRSALLKFQ